MKLRELKQLLREFKFKEIFLNLNYSATTRPEFTQAVGQTTFKLKPIAEQGGLFVLEATVPGSDKVPSRDKCAALDKAISDRYSENLIIFVDEARTDSYFQRAVIVKGKRHARGHRYMKGAPAEPLARALDRLKLDVHLFDDSGQVRITDVTDRLDGSGLFAEKVTKKFFKEFSDLRKGMLKFLGWIQDESKREWYCSVLLNRLMFIYFIAEKGFLPGGKAFLRNQLEANRRGPNGKNTFYTHYLLPLSFFGLGERQGNRGRFEQMFKDVLYLNGGLFAVHSIERELGIDKEAVERASFDPIVSIEDQEFVRWFDYFDKWRWTLDEDKVENEGYISPHILGYIFEKYINQKQMGAYYTKEDITGYICRNTIIPRLFDMLAEASDKGNRAVHPLPIGPHPNLLNDGKGISQGEGIERYIYPAVKTTDYLPTETDYEYTQRQARFESILRDFDAGKIVSIDDFITYNLNIEQLAQDFVENIQDPDVLHDFYFKGLQRISILDPTCGSGAFLFAALTHLYPLYEASLKRMRYLVGKATGEVPDVVNWRGELHFDDLLGSQGVLTNQVETGVLDRMRAEVERINQHPSAEYFIRKSIIVNNLFGVDIMEEAVEICKLRLFLTLIASARGDENQPNNGIEPLPDIDFNIFAGNTLVGYTSISDIDRLWNHASTSHANEIGSLLATDRNHDSLKRDLAEYSNLLTHFRAAQLDPEHRPAVTKDQVLRASDLLRKPLDLDLFDLYAKTGQISGSVATAHAVDPRFPGWKATHEPLHWLLEFPSIEANGGFDVVVGNPPYVESAKVRGTYTTTGYKTQSCGNLYAQVYERSLVLLSKEGRSSFIIPMAALSSRRMEPLRQVWLDSAPMLHTSSYAGDTHPSILFEGVRLRLSIVTCSRVAKAKRSKLYSTVFQRWYAIERPHLFATHEFAETDIGPLWSLFPKVAAGDLNLLWKSLHSSLDCPKLPKHLKTGSGVYYQEAAQYFVKASHQMPRFAKNGVHCEPPHGRFIPCSASQAPVLVAILSSTLFYYWYHVTSDCYHLSDAVVQSFPCPASVWDDAELSALGLQLENVLANNSKEVTISTKTGDVISYWAVNFQSSKTLLDKIDRALARHYSLSESTVEALVSYDSKYRMGSASSEED